jgi:hypothetical protein
MKLDPKRQKVGRRHPSDAICLPGAIRMPMR